jgi:uncharacterized protein YdeI (YjbR/CyaY-like superfamily)
VPRKNPRPIANRESQITNREAQITTRKSRITNERGRVQPASRTAWRSWLAKNHARSSGVWLVSAKKHTGIPSLTYEEAVQEALCFGWIDSLRKPIDDRLYQQLFTPRKPKSVWSAPNKKRVALLVKQGLMTAAGMALVELARRTGTWDALNHVETLTEPPELRAALDKNAKARANWNTLPPGERKRFLYWLSNVKRAATRAARTRQIVSGVARNNNLVQTLASAKR